MSSPPRPTPHPLAPAPTDADALVPLARLAEATGREGWRDLHFRALIENATDVVFVLDDQGNMRYGSPAVRRVLGWLRRDLLGRSAAELVHPDDLPAMRDAMRCVLAAPGAETTVECRVRASSGEYRWLEAVARNLLDDPVVGGIVVNARDVTERRRNLQALAASDERFRLAFESSPIAMFLATPQGEITRANRAFGQLLGYSSAEIAELGWSAITHPDDRARSEELHLAMERGTLDEYQFEKRYLRKCGGQVWVLLTTSLVRDGSGESPYVFAQVHDIGERKRAEEMLRITEERFKMLGRATRDTVYDWDLQSGTLYWSETLYSTFGWAPEQVRLDIDWWSERLHPEDTGRVSESLQRAIDTGASSWSGEYRFGRADGSWATVHDRGYLVRDAAGAPLRMIGAMADITDRKELEAHLRQAQKMDAVGRLAGGIAHDFNNLLTVIASNCELILSEVAPASGVASDVGEIRDAAMRAAALTRQLLAFSRRQVLQPTVLDVNEVIADIEKMLRRVIGEDVSLRTALGDDVGCVRADQNQLEQVIMNLAVNARDAMPQGGTVTITTANVEVDVVAARRRVGFRPGSYVEIAVRDTGVGMEPDVLARVFEPFFTTKEVGKGTGLGLSTVYGIVKQSQGYVYADSTPDHGTTFMVYLPRLLDDAELPSDLAQPPSAPTRHISTSPRTVLIVEDEAVVRAVVRRSLERHGYAVLEAQSAEEALEIFEVQRRGIDAVLTDVVMPGMNGYVLAEELGRRAPMLPVLLMSGYPEEVHRHDPDDVRVLQKPVSAEELAEALREAIGVARGS